MAITILSQPQNYHAGYNPVKFVIDSTNKNNPGFRYIVEIFDKGTSIKLAEFDVAPDPTDNGKGKIDISRIISNKLDKYINIVTNTVAHATTTYYNYDIKFGESYSSEWSFTDYGFNNDFVGGNTGLFQSPQVTPHTFVVGDQVYVETNVTYNDNRSSLTGYFTVIGVVNPYDIVISLTDVGSFPTTPGKVRYADFRKVRTYAMTNILDLVAVNVAQDILEYSNSQGGLNGYVLSAATSNNLTNLPDNFYATPDQTMFLNMLEANSSGFVYFENDGGDIFRKVNGGSFTVKSTGIGPSNVGSTTTVSGTAPLIKPDTKYYDVWVTDNSFNQNGKKLRINLDNRCKINDSEVLFMDRKGSFMSFALQLRNFESIATTKEQYRQYIDGTYSTTSQGLTTYHSKYEKMMVFHTNFMTDEMSRYFEEVYTSPYTYIKWEGNWYAAIIEDGNFQTERIKNNTLIRKTISVRFAVNAPVNI